MARSPHGKAVSLKHALRPKIANMGFRPNRTNGFVPCGLLKQQRDRARSVASVSACHGNAESDLDTSVRLRRVFVATQADNLVSVHDQIAVRASGASQMTGNLPEITQPARIVVAAVRQLPIAGRSVGAQPGPMIIRRFHKMRHLPAPSKVVYER